MTTAGAGSTVGVLMAAGGDPVTGWNARAAALSGVCGPAGAGACAACERSVGAMMIVYRTR